MTRPAVSVRRAAPAALAILFGALLLMSFVMDDVKKAALPAAIGGRRMLGRGAGGQRTLEDFKVDDPFQDSKRRVPNGPDPIHNRYFDLQITALQAWFWCLSWSFFNPCHEEFCHFRKAVAISVPMHRFLETRRFRLKNGFFTTYDEATRYCTSVAFIQLEMEFQHMTFLS